LDDVAGEVLWLDLALLAPTAARRPPRHRPDDAGIGAADKVAAVEAAMVPALASGARNQWMSLGPRANE